MQIRHVKIANFRGIKELDWSPSGDVACLVGHGDSTKSTILDAIELALAGRWNTSIGEADFYGLDTTQPIIVEVTTGQLPVRLLDDAKFGLYLRGWRTSEGKLFDEPAEDDEAVLTVRFEVHESLEPTWRVVNDRNPEGKPLIVQDRDAFGVVRIGHDVDRHLSWGRGSALTKTTEQAGTVKQVLAEAQKKARETIDGADLTGLREASERAETAARRMGVLVRDKFQPSLQGLYGGTAYGLLGLHDGRIPVSSAGLGTRRLVALGLQSLAVTEGGIVLVDEIENGLEPHRLRHLLKTLRPESGKGQVLFTTHSAVTLIELKASDVQFVRSNDGVTVVTVVPGDLQDLLRAMPEAFLALRVLVGEGRTEVGIARGMEHTWASSHGDTPLTQVGGVAVDGGGSKVKVTAEKLSSLGQPTAILVDSDNTALDVGAAWQAKANVSAFSWDDGVCTEERVALDLPWEAVGKMVQIAVEQNSADSVRALVGRELGGAPLTSEEVDSWVTTGRDQVAVRQALGRAANRGRWFKNIDAGEQLGQLIGKHYEAIATTPLRKALDQAGDWLYGGTGHSTATVRS
jgi:putative ATP-dependent endonuclease of the OLD family